MATELDSAPNRAFWERKYSDGSGVEFGVSYDQERGEVTITHLNEIDWPVDELDWLISRLILVRTNTCR